jgi:flagellar biosynthesis/type III secretory pathway protein FliH
MESGLGDLEIRELMRLVHWLLALPDEEELEFRKDVKHMEASMQTKRRSNYERIVWEEGRDEGRLEGRSEGRLEGLDQGRHEGRLIAGRELLLEQIHERFGGCDEALRQRVESIQDETRIRQLARAILTVPTLSEFEARVSV